MDRKDSLTDRPLQKFEQVSPILQGLDDLAHRMDTVSVKERTYKEPESEREHAPQLVPMKQPLQPVLEVPEGSEEANLIDFSDMVMLVKKSEKGGHEEFDPFYSATHTGFVKKETKGQQSKQPVDLFSM